MNNIISLAAIKNGEMPSAKDLAAYVESLKLYSKSYKVGEEQLRKLIYNLPTPRQVENDLSLGELKIIAENIRFLWKKITGQDIIGEVNKEVKSEKLLGNYWIVSKGILVSGPNHCTIAKKNMDLFISLLDIDTFAMHANLSSHPNKLIKLVLDHGGVRLFINKNGKAFFQLTDETYGKWGRKKIKKYDFNEKVVMVIDKNSAYNGWKSGIRINI